MCVTLHPRFEKKAPRTATCRTVVGLRSRNSHSECDASPFGGLIFSIRNAALEFIMSALVQDKMRHAFFNAFSTFVPAFFTLLPRLFQLSFIAFFTLFSKLPIFNAFAKSRIPSLNARKLYKITSRGTNGRYACILEGACGFFRLTFPNRVKPLNRRPFPYQENHALPSEMCKHIQRN